MLIKGKMWINEHRGLLIAIGRVKWRHSNLWSWYDISVVGHNVVLCEVGEDFLRCLNKIESVGLRTAYCQHQIGKLTVSAGNVYISLPYTRTADIDRNDEITLLSPYV